MPCRIGITTDPARREREWRRRYPGLRWRKLRSGLTRAQAQQQENQLAVQAGCQAHAGGSKAENPNTLYTVYRFDY